jgi:hypothetical protein
MNHTAKDLPALTATYVGLDPDTQANVDQALGEYLTDGQNRTLTEALAAALDERA